MIASGLHCSVVMTATGRKQPIRSGERSVNVVHSGAQGGTGYRKTLAGRGTRRQSHYRKGCLVSVAPAVQRDKFMKTAVAEP